MSKFTFYTIKDLKADVFYSPVLQKHEVEFCRAMTETLKEHIVFSTYPSDFEVFVIGSFDDISGKIRPEFKSIGTISELIKSQKVIHTGYDVNNIVEFKEVENEI